MSMTTQEIMEILPHRHPFLLIDFIDELEPGVRAVGYKCIRDYKVTGVQTCALPICFLPVIFREIRLCRAC